MPGSDVPVIRQPFGPGDRLPYWAAGRALSHHLYDLDVDPDEAENRAGEAKVSKDRPTCSVPRSTSWRRPPISTPGCGASPLSEERLRPPQQPAGTGSGGLVVLPHHLAA